MNKIDEIKIDIIRRVANMSKEAALIRCYSRKISARPASPFIDSRKARPLIMLKYS